MWLLMIPWSLERGTRFVPEFVNSCQRMYPSAIDTRLTGRRPLQVAIGEAQNALKQEMS